MTLPTAEELERMQRNLDELKRRVAAEDPAVALRYAASEAAEDPNSRVNNNILQFRGRISGGRYALTMLGVLFVSFLTSSTLTVMDAHPEIQAMDGYVYGAFAVLAVYVLNSVVAIFAGIKRCHDIRLNPWWNLLIVAPIVCLVWVCYLCVKKSKYEN